MMDGKKLHNYQSPFMEPTALGLSHSHMQHLLIDWLREY